MKELNKNTKKAAGLVESYNFSVSRYGVRDIYDAYRAPSVYKVRAWRDIAAMCARLNGHGLTVTGYNCMKYSAAFIATDADGVEKLFYFTADNSYSIAL